LLPEFQYLLPEGMAYAFPLTASIFPCRPIYDHHPSWIFYFLCTPSRVFVESKAEGKGGDPQFNLNCGEEGSHETVAGIEGGDRPLFVQFCANDPDVLLAAAKKVEHRCDAVDINFLPCQSPAPSGCPQGIAKRGNYGAFLQDDWELIKRLVGTLHENLAVPVTAKFRIFPDLERTLTYAKMMEAAGAQILTCHGRTREMKGQATGLADWKMIAAVKKAVKIPVFANGNVLYREDVDRCLEMTGCDGVMTAEGNLSNPAIFLPPDHPYLHPSVIVLANRYLDIVASLKTITSISAIKAHMFRMFKSVLDTDENLRIMIAKCQMRPGDELKDFRDMVQEVDQRCQSAFAAAGPSWRAPPIEPATGYRRLPIFAAQPSIRQAPTPKGLGDDKRISEEHLVDGETSSRPNSPSLLNVSATCVHTDPIACVSIAAIRCTTKACLIHCRQLRAVRSGMDPAVAARKAVGGGLVGMGCEPHEAKAAARKERWSDKRKSRSEWKAVVKTRRVEAKQEARVDEVVDAEVGVGVND
ncbi:MAG: hypothetical protein TREMPRED_001344, partial [Tremellales sp. Tagirdzhanova-0007]